MRNYFFKTFLSLAVLFSTVTGLAQQTVETTTPSSADFQQTMQQQPQMQDPRLQPDPSLMESDPTTEKQFLQQLKGNLLNATGSGNGGDPLALRFVNLANTAIRVCGISKKIQSQLPEQWPFFKTHFSEIRVRKVHFSLCAQDDSSRCSIGHSLAVKNVPELQLILVNGPLFAQLSESEQLQQALSHILQILDIPPGVAGISTPLAVERVVIQTANGLSLQERCEERP